MKALSIMSCGLLVAASTAFAMDDMKKTDGMTKDGTAMTTQQCKDHMAMSDKAGMKKDDVMMKKDAMCADMMKSDSTKSMKKGDSTMKPAGKASAPMSK